MPCGCNCESTDQRRTNRLANACDHRAPAGDVTIRKRAVGCSACITLLSAMSDAQVTLPDSVTDELYRSAKRVTEEVIRLTERPTHDGTKCVLVPERIMERLERAVVVADGHTPEDWRP